MCDKSCIVLVLVNMFSGDQEVILTVYLASRYILSKLVTIDSGCIRMVTNDVTVMDVHFKEKKDSEDKHQILTSIDSDDNEMLTDFQECVDKAVEKARLNSSISSFFADEEQVRHPLFPSSRKTDDPTYAKCYSFTASSKYDVQVFDAVGNSIANPASEIHNGTVVRLIIDFKAYVYDEEPRIGVYIKGIQKIRDGEPIKLKATQTQSMWELFAEC